MSVFHSQHVPHSWTLQPGGQGKSRALVDFELLGVAVAHSSFAFQQLLLIQYWTLLLFKSLLQEYWPQRFVDSLPIFSHV